MTDVFISYSRANLEFAEALFDSLQARKVTAWIDWQNIPRSAGWWDEIKRGIDTASTFVYLMSEASVSSAVCTLELVHAIENGKRIIPVVIEPVNFEVALGKIAAVRADNVLSKMLDNRDLLILARDNRTVISEINWVFFNQNAQGVPITFESAVDELITTIHTDLGHNRKHASLLIRAREWDTNARPPDLLLIGEEIDTAETWLKQAQAKAKQPFPTYLHEMYIRESREVETARRRLLRNLRVASVVFAVIGLISIAAVISSFISLDNTQQQTNQANTQVAGVIPTLAAADTQVAGVQPTLMSAQSTLAVANEAVENAQSVLESLNLQIEQQQTELTARRLADRASDLLLTNNLIDALPIAVYANKITLPVPPPSVQNVLSRINNQSSILRQFTGHTDWIESLAWLPDGTRMVTASGDETAVIWDVATGEKLHVLAGHTNSVSTMVVSQDGTFIVTGSPDQSLIFWDAATGDNLKVINAEEWIETLALSSDDRLLAAGLRFDDDNRIGIWDVESGELIRYLQGHNDFVTTLMFSPDNQTLLSGANDSEVFLWDLETGEVLRDFVGHTDTISDIDFHPAENQFITGDWQGVINLWDFENGEIIRTYDDGDGGISPVFALEFSLNGSAIYSADGDRIRVWSTERGNVFKEYAGHGNSVSDLALSPDSKSFLSGSWDNTVIHWTFSNSRTQRRYEGHTDRIPAVVFMPDGESFVSASWDTTLIRWSAETGEQLHRYEGHRGKIDSLAASPDGRLLASGGCFEDNEIVCLAGEILIWSVDTGEIVHRIEAHTDTVTSLTFSPDSLTLLSGSYANDGSIKLWDVESGAVLQRFEYESTASVLDLTFVPDGSRFITTMDDNISSLWDMASAEIIHSFTGHTQWVEAVDISSDGRYALTASRDGTVRMWNLETLEFVQAFQGHNDDVLAVEIAPDDQTAFSVSYDDTIIQWDLQTGQPLYTYNDDFNSANDLAISPDGQQLVIATLSDYLKSWEIMSIEDELDWACQHRFVRDFSNEDRRAYSIPDEILNVCEL